MISEVLPPKLIVAYFQIHIVEVLLSIRLTMIKINLLRFLYHVDILFVLILETRNNGAVVWFAQDVCLVDLGLDLFLHFGCYRAHRLQHRRFGACGGLS